MKTLKLAVVAAGLLASAGAFAQTAGGTQNTGPQGTGNLSPASPKATVISSPASRKAPATRSPESRLPPPSEIAGKGNR